MEISQHDQKIQQDIERVKKDVNSLKEDSIAMASENLGQSTENLAAWVNNGVTQLSSEFERVKGNAKETMTQAATTIKKNVGDSLVQYNTKAADIARKLPGGVGEKAVKYPWAALSIALFAGFMMRGLLMSRR